MKASQDITSAAPVELFDGERYVGLVVTADRRMAHHIILLPEPMPGEASWDSAMAWAKKRGGDLPDRVEGALLFVTLRDEFEKRWYWLNEQVAGDAGYAWVQSFLGFQNLTDKDWSCRARAVRRVPA
ncbi:MAG: DUF1566 domain-containing protein [Burkholderiales bacterium]|nr:DUF1566 domain-containing protein [Burkholderiales bacterium]